MQELLLNGRLDRHAPLLRQAHSSCRYLMGCEGLHCDLLLLQKLLLPHLLMSLYLLLPKLFLSNNLLLHLHGLLIRLLLATRRS